MTGQREVPPLIHVAPDCPVCWDAVTFDGDGWACKPCGFTWTSDAYDAMGEGEGEQCAAEVAPYADDEQVHNLRDWRFRCIRSVGHRATGTNSLERHVGMRSDTPPHYDSGPFEWADGEYPQVEHP